MQKVSIKIDINKLDKSKIVKRTFTNKEGKEVEVKELSLEVIPLKEKKLIKEGDGWKLMKVGFVAEGQTKEERASQAKSNIVGDATQFETANPTPSFSTDSRGKKIEAEEIDF